MKEKNKKLIMIVSVLLLFGGISLAYFASQVLSSGRGSSTKGTTASINGATVTVIGNLEFNDTSIYPGHKNVSSIKVTATGDNELIPYNLIWTGTNSLNTPLNYTIYKTSSNIDVEATCEKKMKIENGAQILKEECSISNIESLGTEISSGTISTSNTETKVTLATDEFITATTTGLTMYYYVILEYPNLEASQNEDIGGTFAGKVNVEASNTEPDINILAAYIEQEDGSYQESKDIPQIGYILNTSKSTCSNGTTPGWDMAKKRFYADNLTKSGTSCYLYFDIVASGTILANKTISTRTDFSTTLTADTTGTIYTAEDDYGTSYYFAGAPTDNWVKFAGFYWRIIRINGDGTIRMIYQGTAANTTGEETKIGTSAFNASYNDNAYVGYMYKLGEVHGLETDSTIKGVLDAWYDNNLASYVNYIDASPGFCADRIPSTISSSNNGSGGTGTTRTYYNAFIRLISNRNPNLKCVEKKDILNENIGLIVADEIVYAGGSKGINNNYYYLFSGYNYWSISPSDYNNETNMAYGLIINENGVFDGDYITHSNGVRPVINLRADTQFADGGTGTAENPYVVQ